MPNLEWSKLNHLQLGRYAEYLAKMEFTSYGYEVYTSEVDDHGIDFVAKKPNSTDFLQIQVKSIRNNNYVFIKESKFDENMLVCYVRFVDNESPHFYIFPAEYWYDDTKKAFVIKEYKTGKEYGINYSKRNFDTYDNNLIENYLKQKDEQ